MLLVQGQKTGIFLASFQMLKGLNGGTAATNRSTQTILAIVARNLEFLPDSGPDTRNNYDDGPGQDGDKQREKVSLSTM